MTTDDVLVHYGIKGQKWGIRNYQYEDGTLTPAGKERYGVGTGKSSRSSSSSNTSGSASISGGGGGSAVIEEKDEEELEEEFAKLTNQLLQMFGGNRADMARYVTISKNADNISQSMFIIKNPVTKTQSVFKLNQGSTMMSFLTKTINDSVEMMNNANKRTAAAQKQDAALKAKEERARELAKKRTQAAQKQDLAKRADEIREAAAKRTAAAQKQTEANRDPFEKLVEERMAAAKRTQAAKKQDAAKKDAAMANLVGERTATAKSKAAETAAKRTQAAKKQDAAKKAAEAEAKRREKELDDAMAKLVKERTAAAKSKKAAEAAARTAAAKKQDAAKKAEEAKKAAKTAELIKEAKERAEEQALKDLLTESQSSRYPWAEDKKKKSVKHSDVYATTDDILVHHGVLGMKWGVRRYQNEDGSLTEAGKARVSKKYSKGVKKLTKYESKLEGLNRSKNKLDEQIRKQDYKANRPKRMFEGWNAYNRRTDKAELKLKSLENSYRKIDWKAEKTYNKGAKWVEKMSKKFSDVDLSSVNKDDIAYVERYLSSVMDDYRRVPHKTSSRRSSGKTSKPSTRTVVMW